MAFLVTAALVALVHLLTATAAWTGVGLLADDHQMVGMGVLRHGVMPSGAPLPEALQVSFGSMFLLPPLPDGAAIPAVALYRPFLDLLFFCEQPFFGIDAFGYHVVNSLMHCLTAVLWSLLVRRLSGSALAGLATAVLFAGWPGHSEVTHWIAARTNVMSICWLSVALVVHDVALGCARPGQRRIGLGLAAFAAVVAVGTKESAIFVLPLAGLLAWHRVGFRLAVVRTLPMALGLFAWLAWRAHGLGTWGTGTGYGWKASRIDAASCLDWLQVLLAPAHHTFVPTTIAWVMAAAHGVLLALTFAALRQRAARAAAAIGALLLGLGYLAGVGLESLHLPTLENVRYTYEPALGLCVLFGLGLATLPWRLLVVVLAGMVALHAWVLDHNRTSWLRVSANYERMRADILDIARTTRQPLRVFDAPGVHDGAFGFLNGQTEFTFLKLAAPAGTDLNGAVSSSFEWHTVLHELATAAASPGKQLPMPTFVAQWHDGSLERFALDPQWPAQPFPGVSIGYARPGRTRPFVGSELPVHVVLHTDGPLLVWAEANLGELRWFEAPVTVAASTEAIVRELTVPLPRTLAADVPVTITLVVQKGDEQRRFPLGVTVPANR